VNVKVEEFGLAIEVTLVPGVTLVAGLPDGSISQINEDCLWR
jgi:hypothetical protein